MGKEKGNTTEEKKDVVFSSRLPADLAKRLKTSLAWKEMTTREFLEKAALDFINEVGIAGTEK